MSETLNDPLEGEERREKENNLDIFASGHKELWNDQENHNRSKKSEVGAVGEHKTQNLEASMLKFATM